MMQIFLVGNSMIFRLTDKESTYYYKNMLLGKIKTTGTLWYQFIEFPLLYCRISAKYKSYFGSSVELSVYFKEGCGKTRIVINITTPHLYSNNTGAHSAPMTAYTRNERCSLSPDSENFHILFEGTKNTFNNIARLFIASDSTKIEIFR